MICLSNIVICLSNISKTQHIVRNVKHPKITLFQVGPDVILQPNPSTSSTFLESHICGRTDWGGHMKPNFNHLCRSIEVHCTMFCGHGICGGPCSSWRDHHVLVVLELLFGRFIAKANFPIVTTSFLLFATRSTSISRASAPCQWHMGLCHFTIIITMTIIIVIIKYYHPFHDHDPFSMIYP